MSGYSDSSLHPGTGYTFLAGLDESAAYEIDVTEIWRKDDGTFALLTASGCSCWDGDYDEESYATLDDLAAALVDERTDQRTYNPAPPNVAGLVAAARAAETP